MAGDPPLRRVPMKSYICTFLLVPGSSSSSSIVIVAAAAAQWLIKAKSSQSGEPGSVPAENTANHWL